MGAKFRLLKSKGQEQEREHIQKKKTMMLSEFWLHFNIVIIFVMTLFNILRDLPRYSYKIKTIIHVFPIKMSRKSFHYSTFVCLDVSEDEVDCCVVISSWSFDCLSTVQFVGYEFLKDMLFKRFRSLIYIKVSK